MGFLKGRVTYQKLMATKPTTNFDPEVLNNKRLAEGDVAVYWGAGDSILDKRFELEKNLINDAAVFDFVVETQRLPSELLRAYTLAELAGKPHTAANKRAAKEAAREQLEEEGRDGRFTRRRATPVMWDQKSGNVFFGATSGANVGRFATLFNETFGLALEQKEMSEDEEGLTPSSFSKVIAMADRKWEGFLGNEFLMWLCYANTTELMVAATMTLDCPDNASGTDTFKYDAPAMLPEVKEALRSGKLPRKLGLMFAECEFKLDDCLVVSGAKLPEAKAEGSRARLEERVDAIRDLDEALSGLYGRFVEIRSSDQWVSELESIKQWVSQ